jgi:hypothetical protein
MSSKDTIVGVWFVKVIGAPFEYHVFTFNSDGTFIQSNPDAGDPDTSDSMGMGLWKVYGGKITAKFVETTADRKTHTFVARGEISLDVTLDKDTITGFASATFFDESNKKIKGPTHEELKGVRISLDKDTPSL